MAPFGRAVVFRALVLRIARPRVTRIVCAAVPSKSRETCAPSMRGRTRSAKNPTRRTRAAALRSPPNLPPKPVYYRRPAKLLSFCHEAGERFAHAGLYEGVVFVDDFRVGNFRVFLRR